MTKQRLIPKFNLQHFAQTKLTNLIDPEVMADMVEEYIGSKTGKFDDVVTDDNTLVGAPGSTITVPKWGYIGDAEDLTEGVAMDTSVMSATESTVTIKAAGKAVEITDSAAISGYGDPIGTAARQIGEAIMQKKDRDISAVLAAAATVKGDGTAVVALADILAAKLLFGDEDDDEMITFYCHPYIYGDIVALCEALETNFGDFVKQDGEVVKIYGMPIKRSNKCVQTGTGATAFFTSYLAKPMAVKMYNKRGTFLETDRDILAKTTTMAADKHYVPSLFDERYAVAYKAKHALA